MAEDGATIDIEVDGGSCEELVRRWPAMGLVDQRGGARSDASDERTVAIRHRQDATDVPRGDAIDLVVDGVATAGGWCRVESELSLFAAEHLVGRVAIHAGLAVHRGRAIVLPGPSFVGKSTLCLALIDLGVEVRTDEYVLVDERDGSVTGWDRPLRRRRGDGGVDQVRRPLGTAAPIAPGVVAALRHRAGPDEPWTRTTSARTVEHLLANAVCARRRPSATFDVALALARGSIGFEGVRGEAHAAARRLVTLVDEVDEGAPSPT